MSKKEKNNIHIPANEIQVSFARSSGAGGQNVNKTSTKVVIHWSIGRLHVLTSEEKSRVRGKLANKINSNDEIVIMSEEERSQPQNRALAMAKLQELMARALHIPKKRRLTKLSESSKLRRIESKKIRSRVKAGRRTTDQLYGASIILYT